MAFEGSKRSREARRLAGGPRGVRDAADALELSKPKLLGELISSATSLWLSRPGIFIAAAALIIIPFQLIVQGVLGGGFAHPTESTDLWARLVSLFYVNVLGTALITASHAKSVVALSEGKTLTTAGALKLGFAGFGLVVLAGLLYALATIVGFVLIIIPGLFLYVAGAFTAQYAALERKSPFAALKASVKLVRAAGWWRTWGYLIVIGLLEELIGFIVGLVVGILINVFGASPATGDTVILVVVIVIQAGSLSFTALINTLLYFSWRAQTEAPVEVAEPHAVG